MENITIHWKDPEAGQVHSLHLECVTVRRGQLTYPGAGDHVLRAGVSDGGRSDAHS